MTEVSNTFLRNRVAAFLLAAALLAGTQTARADAPLPAKIDFNRDVRPILSDTCFACHGPDKNTRKANLRLDTRDGAMAAIKGGGNHPIVAGHPEQSEVFLRVSSTDADELMPPAKFNKTLSPRQIAILKKWIEDGAEFKDHWAYLPIQHPPVPSMSNVDGFVRGPIDELVLSRLKEVELSHAPEADRVTLIRRLYFDLVGLPPKKTDVDAFVNDTSENAYEKVVDGLLANPHFGERMAVFWLDLVRYADSIGYHSDNPMSVQPFRDYVIQSFNENVPFDRFTTEQLAGDLLPDATARTRVGSGYNRLLQTTGEGGAQAKEYVAKYAADRVRNVSTVWLGQTMGCAECHDHKFDPTTTKDFYTMAAFFADVQEVAVGLREPGVPVLDVAAEAKVKSLEAAVAELRMKLNADTPELAAAQAEWEKRQATAESHWTTLDASTFTTANGATLAKQPDKSIKAGGTAAATEVYTVTASSTAKGVTAFRLEVFADDAFPGKGPGVSPNGNFVLTEFKILATTAGGAPTPVKIRKASADFAQDKFLIANVLDGKDDTGWAILPQTGTSHVAVFETEAPVTSESGDVTFTFVLEHKEKYGQHNIGRFRISVATETDPSDLKIVPEAVKTLLATPADKRSEGGAKELTAYYRGFAPLLQPARDQLAAVERERNGLIDAALKTLITIAGEPRVTRILHRGNWQDDSGEVVQPAVPAFLGKLDVTGRRANRLDLAQWLVRKDNPLTSRVFTNRIWRMLMGRGLTQPLDDLGLQGELPADPELLDYLSSDFVDHGWDIKRLIRTIVTSGTYRQSSRPSSVQMEADPFNRLFARQGRFRLDAEFVRDNALAVSGLLSSRVGGASAKPYQPAGYWFALNFPPREWENDKGESLYRRGVYTWWQRSFLHPSLAAFDASTHEECTAERPRSNIPQQALALLNDPTYVEAARVFAEKIIRQGGADAPARIRWAIGEALSRPASDQELQVLTDLVRHHYDVYGKDTDAAQSLISNGAAPVPKDLNVVELAAWTSAARTILNLHETITRY